MKRFTKILSLLLLICVIVTSLAACGEGECTHQKVVGGVCANCGETVQVETKDWATEVTLDMTSTATKKAEVTLKLHVDGDTVHFYAPTVSEAEGGVVKARFLAIDTPESTGRIEEWGKKASTFTKAALATASSIVIESDDENWNMDSNGRFLLWIWYKPQGSDTYRNLNIDLLQNGLAIAYNTGSTRYGTIGFSAIAQAKMLKLNIQSKKPDPDFYYGDAYEITLKELRTNIASYNGKKVAFTGVITINNANTAYVEEYDEETGLYFGMTVYYGYNMNGEALDILEVGNEARIVGTVTLYEGSGNYQVSGLQYKIMKPKDPDNLQLISQNNIPSYVETDADTLVNGKLTLTVNEGLDEAAVEKNKEFAYGNLVLNTTVSLKNLRVTSFSTTTNEESSQKGAFTLYCTALDGTSIAIRTIVLYDDAGNLVSGESFVNKTISVVGMVDYYSGKYQIKVFSLDDIIVE